MGKYEKYSSDFVEKFTVVAAENINYLSKRQTINDEATRKTSVIISGLQAESVGKKSILV